MIGYTSLRKSNSQIDTNRQPEQENVHDNDNVHRSSHADFAFLSTPSLSLTLFSFFLSSSFSSSSGRLRLWVNGVLEKTDFGFPTGIQTGLRPHNIIGRNVHGVVKDIRIWNVPLGPNEIKELEETIRDTYQ